MPTVDIYRYTTAVDFINGITEHYYGSGPIEDGGATTKQAIAAAKRVAKGDPELTAQVNREAKVITDYQAGSRQ